MLILEKTASYETNPDEKKTETVYHYNFWPFFLELIPASEYEAYILSQKLKEAHRRKQKN